MMKNKNESDGLDEGRLQGRRSTELNAEWALIIHSSPIIPARAAQLVPGGARGGRGVQELVDT